MANYTTDKLIKDRVKEATKEMILQQLIKSIENVVTAYESFGVVPKNRLSKLSHNLKKYKGVNNG